jgi:hypothetical protein
MVIDLAVAQIAEHSTSVAAHKSMTLPPTGRKGEQRQGQEHGYDEGSRHRFELGTSCARSVTIPAEAGFAGHSTAARRRVWPARGHTGETGFPP